MHEKYCRTGYRAGNKYICTDLGDCRKPHYERQVSADYVHGQNNDEEKAQQDHRSDQDRNTGLYHSGLRFGWQIQSERNEKEQ